MGMTSEQQNAQDAHVKTMRQYYEPDTVPDTPPSLHKPAQSKKYTKHTNRYMSILPVYYEQAGRIAERHPKTYKNWQTVIRRAIGLGLPQLELPQEQLTAIKQGLELVPINKSGGGGFRTHCPVTGQPTECYENKCRECKDAGRPLYEPEK